MVISITNSVKISSQYRFQWEEAQQGFVLLYPEGMVQLNPSAGEILSRCQEPTTIEAIILDLKNAFAEADIKELTVDVMEFIHDANDQGWLEISD